MCVRTFGPYVFDHKPPKPSKSSVNEKSRRHLQSFDYNLLVYTSSSHMISLKKPFIFAVQSSNRAGRLLLLLLLSSHFFLFRFACKMPMQIAARLLCCLITKSNRIYYWCTQYGVRLCRQLCHNESSIFSLRYFSFHNNRSRHLTFILEYHLLVLLLMPHTCACASSERYRSHFRRFMAGACQSVCQVSKQINKQCTLNYIGLQIRLKYYSI